MRAWLGHRIVWYRVMSILEEHSRSILPGYQKSEAVSPDQILSTHREITRSHNR